jgi:hypothetical protein
MLNDAKAKLTHEGYGCGTRATKAGVNDPDDDLIAAAKPRSLPTHEVESFSRQMWRPSRSLARDEDFTIETEWIEGARGQLQLRLRHRLRQPYKPFCRCTVVTT